MTFYKVLDGVRSTNGGDYRYPGVGRWTAHLDGDLVPCERGFHLADGERQLLWWLGPAVYTAEPCPDHDLVYDVEKVVTCRVRLVARTAWDDRMARLFAADCAEAALLGERASGREPDGRLWEAVEVARRYADGDADKVRLAAAWDAAWDAFWAAAGAAAGATARAASWAAAWDAAGGAVRAASWAASGAAARDLMAERLAVYLSGDDPGPVVPLYGGAA